MRAATSPRADAWPAWKVLHELGGRLAPARSRDFPQPFSGAQAVFAALAQAVPAYAGLSYARLGDHGRSIASGGGNGSGIPRSGGAADDRAKAAEA